MITRLNPQGHLQLMVETPTTAGLGFRVLGSGLRVWGLGVRTEGLVFRIRGLGFRGCRNIEPWLDSDTIP